MRVNNPLSFGAFSRSSRLNALFLFMDMEFAVLGALAGGTLVIDGVAALYFLGAFNKHLVSLESWYAYRRSREYRLAKQAAKADRAMFREIRKAAKFLAPRIVNALASQGYCYIYERQGARRKASKVKLGDCLMTHEAIYYHVRKTPFRVQFTDLLVPEVAQNLSIAIGRECRFLNVSAGDGLWLQVELLGGIASVPRHFAWHNEDDPHCAVELLPKTEPWRVAVGMGSNRKFYYEDPRTWPHAIVAGMTGGGKSVWLRQFLATLIGRLTPSQLQFVLIDLKGGLEFGRDFEGLPHLRTDVVFEREEVGPALAGIVSEKERRWTMFRAAGNNSITSWNAANPARRLPYIFIIFDEIASLMLSNDKKLKRAVEGLIEDLAGQGRALGIHLILCTQIPSREVLSTIIRGNIPTRLCFAMDHTGSMLTLGNQQANEIHPGGRLVYKSGGEQVVLQGPYISEDQLKAAIDRATNQDLPEERHIKLFRYSLAELRGAFGITEIAKAPGGSKYHAQKIGKAWEYDPVLQQPIIELDGGRYLLTPGFRVYQGNLPRLLIEAPDSLPGSTEAVRELAISAYESRFTDDGKNGG